MTVAWSHTSLNMFENCPRQYKLIRVTKKIKQSETEEMKWGNKVHSELESRILFHKELPKELTHLEPMMNRIMKSEGEVMAERQLAITANFKPTEWFAKDVWCRVIIDVAVKKERSLWLGDYKTGKRKPDNEQLQLFAAVGFNYWPDVAGIKTSFIWLKDKKIDNAQYQRSDLKTLWEPFLARVARLEAAYESDRWPAKPSGLCGWCPVTKTHCEFSKKES